MPLYTYFIGTLLIELPIVLLLLKGTSKEKLLIAFLLNLFTWPLLQVIYANYLISIYVLEIGVFILEGIGYWLFFKQNNSWLKCMLIALIANAVSYGVGLLIVKYFE
ncbi:MAG: hypothetical protein KBF36_10700 [Chitinophagaceae bacterium]|nr:hypothetical protein [Chitinophagaceae bacterium]